MPKHIFMPEQGIAQMVEYFGKTPIIDVNMKLESLYESTIKEKAHISYSTLAWAKQLALLEGFEDEVAWYATVKRDPEDYLKFDVLDIFVYPQTVTKAHVDMDADAFGEWQKGFPDEVFFNLRLQAHSHVKMGVTPSGTDIDHQKKIAMETSLSSQNRFHIFMIWNKYLVNNAIIYDFENNLIFEDKEIQISIGEYDLSDFVEDAKKIAVTKVYTPPPAYTQPTSYPAVYEKWGANANKEPVSTASVTPAKTAKPEEKNIKSAGKSENKSKKGHKGYVGKNMKDLIELNDRGFYYEGGYYPYD